MNQLVQIIIAQCVSVGFSIYISRTHVLMRVYVATFMSSCVNLVMYLLNGDSSTAIACGIVAVRGFIYIFRDRYRIPPPVIPAAFVVIHLVSGLLTIQNPWQLITIAAPCITCIYLWYCHNLQHLRIGHICVCLLWVVYDTHSSLFIVAVADAVVFLANLTAYIQNRTELAVIYGEKAAVRHG